MPEEERQCRAELAAWLRLALCWLSSSFLQVCWDEACGVWSLASARVA